MPFSNGHALVIGVNTYQPGTFGSYAQVKADAQAVRDVLVDPKACGYPESQVALLTDEQTTRDGILAALDALATREYGADGTVVLFYCGHGLDGEDGAYYLTSTDVKTVKPVGPDGKPHTKVAAATGIAEGLLIEKLRAIKAERMLLIFNACHSGNISPTLGEGDEQAETGKPVPAQTASALLSAGSGRIIITACRPEQVSYVGLGTQTIFGEVLVAALHGKGANSQRGYISAFDVYTTLYDDVSAAVKALNKPPNLPQVQEPQLTVLQGVGPFAVALYPGAMTLGEPEPDERPRPDTAVREVSAEESRRALEQIMSVGQGVAAGRDIANSTVVGRDQVNIQGSPGAITGQVSGPVSQNFGTQTTTTVNSGGGPAIVGSQLDKSNINVGSTFGGSYIVGDTVTVGASTPSASEVLTLDEALARVQQAAEQARQAGNADLADGLDVVALKLTQSQKETDAGRRQQRLAGAIQEIESLAKSQSAGQDLVQLLRRVR